MNTTARPVCLFLALALAACSSSVDPASRPTTFDGEVLRVSFERDDGGKETFSTLRDEWYSWPWFPIMPNQSGRRWTMLKTDREGVSVAYALVSWDNDDPTDYMSAGFWMRFDDVQRTRRLPASEAEIVPFIDGPEIDLRFPPALPVSGTARYVGSAGGVYQYRPTGGAEPVAEEFAATMTIAADFDRDTLAGCIGCVGDIELQREHLYTILGWRRGDGELDNPPTDYQIHYGPTEITAKGSFKNTTATVTHPERAVTQSEGSWHGSFSNRPAADGAPRLAAGQANAAFTEADGGEGSFDSIFIALHPTLLPQRPPAPAPGP